MAPIALIELAPGQGGRLCAPAPGEVVSERLQALGLVPGTHVRLVRRAPLGDPVELELRGYRLCLRAGQLTALRVELASGPHGRVG